MTEIEIAKLSPLLLLGHPQPVLVDDVNSTDRCAQELHGSTHLVRHQVCALVHVGSQVTTQFGYDRFADLVDDACEIKFSKQETTSPSATGASPVNMTLGFSLLGRKDKAVAWTRSSSGSSPIQVQSN